MPHHLFSEACGNGLAVNPNLKDPLVGEDTQFLTTPNEKVNPDVDYEELDLTSFFKVSIRSGDEDEPSKYTLNPLCVKVTPQHFFTSVAPDASPTRYYT